MKKHKYLILAATLACVNLQAQTLSEAMRLSDNEQYDAATDVFRQLVAKEPANATNYYYFGENYLLSDNADSALIMFEQGAKADPANFLPQIGHVKHLLNMYSVAEMKRNSNISNDDYQKVKANFDKLTQKSAEDEAHLNNIKAKASEADALYQKAVANVKAANILLDETVAKAGPKNVQVLIEAADALIHFKNKDLDKAKGYLDKASALQPKNAEIKILYGDVYSELNNGTLAAEYYNKALDLEPKSVKAIVNKGRLYKRSKNFDGAAEEFKNAIKIDDSFAPAHRELGECYYRLGKLEDAKAEYRKFLELSKNNCDARFRYASFLYLSKDYAGAIQEINQMNNTCDASNPRLLRVTAYSLYEIKDSAKALIAVQKLFEKVPEENLIEEDYEYYGKINIINNKDSLGVEMLRKAYLMDSNRCDLLTEIYKSYDKMKKGATVTDYFNLGRSYFFSTNYMSADTAFSKVNELSPKYASGFLWRAKANSFIDSTMTLGLAKPHYEKYIEVASADTAAAAKYKSGLVEAYRYLAAYFVKVDKNLKLTLDYVNKALEIDPENKELQEWKKSLEFELDPKNKKTGNNK